ncbi:hypothetical protein TSAR_016122 [Trichomalopsis sarcophagae]|uniref:CDC48 N-terminal subdomain domain-containing protein n=1 Tax=Trichomalopsis sarcophagae TaxID=543379 RepID=A0A232FLU4_9HYME|nr:hypothetical protein TSAR_016122 [Trichomalopsis sarcophagae]
MSLPCSLLVDHSSTHPDRFIALMSATKIQELNLENNSTVQITGRDSKMVFCTLKESIQCGDIKILLNKLMRHNLGVLVNDPVIVSPCCNLQYAAGIDIAVNYTDALKGLNRDICKVLVNEYFAGKRIILCEGNKFIVRKGMKAVEFVVVKTDPTRPYCLVDTAKVSKVNYLTDVARYKPEEKRLSHISYEDIGGYVQQLQQLRELEFPLRLPSLFKQLKVANPHIIMHGPQGVGKLLLAKAFASEINAHFVLLNESMTKDVPIDIKIVRIWSKLEEAKKNSPSVVCFDGLHEIAPKTMTDPNQHKFLIKELVKMLKQMEQDKSCIVILIGITHLLSQVNTGVLHHFYSTKNDKNITFVYPNFFDRYEILKIHTRDLALSSNFDFNHLAASTENYTGERLAALCKKVAWRVYKNKHEDSIGVEDEVDEAESFMNKVITLADFQDVLDEMS